MQDLGSGLDSLVTGLPPQIVLLCLLRIGLAMPDLGTGLDSLGTGLDSMVTGLDSLLKSYYYVCYV